MGKIRILWVGKTRQRYLAEGIEEFLKRLTPWAQVSVVEIKEEHGERPAAVAEAEGKRILKQTSTYWLLDDKGREFTSPEFAAFVGGAGAIDFVIGGAFGVSEEVRQRASGIIALSRMTLTHEMARLIFMEQLYRAFTILKGKGYHH